MTEPGTTHRAPTTQPASQWPFGPDSAALLIARTSWPMENDDNRRSWSKRLTDPAERGMLEAEYTQARERLAEAYGILRAAPTPPTGEHVAVDNDRDAEWCSCGQAGCRKYLAPPPSGNTDNDPPCCCAIHGRPRTALLADLADARTQLAAVEAVHHGTHWCFDAGQQAEVFPLLDGTLCPTTLALAAVPDSKGEQ